MSPPSGKNGRKWTDGHYGHFFPKIFIKSHATLPISPGLSFWRSTLSGEGIHTIHLSILHKFWSINYYQKKIFQGFIRENESNGVVLKNHENEAEIMDTLKCGCPCVHLGFHIFINFLLFSFED